MRIILVVCQLAKEKFQVSRTVAKVNDPRNEQVFSSLGVDVPIDATAILAKIIEEEVSFADFVNLMSFKRGKLAIVRVDLPNDSPVINKQLQELKLPEDSVLVSIIRQEQVIVPKGNTVLLSGDDVIAPLPFAERTTAFELPYRQDLALAMAAAIGSRTIALWLIGSQTMAWRPIGLRCASKSCLYISINPSWESLWK